MLDIAKRWGALFAVLSGLAGCSANIATDPVATERAAESDFPNSGFVPYPILYELENGSTYVPVLGSADQYLPGWDGSVADLIAADAYVFCSTSGPYKSSELSDDFYAGAGNDRYLQYLVAKMGEVLCLSRPDSMTEELWHDQRVNKECNLDARTGKFSKVKELQRNSNGYDSFYESDLGTWGLTGPANIKEAARKHAAQELEYADLNLCMAQYLREKANSGQSLFTASEDQTEILGVIRERSQLASLYYAFLAKIASYEQTTGSEPANISSAKNDWMVLLRRWLRDVATEAELTRIGEDFATAVRLTVQSTRELATTLQRSAGQRPIGTSGVFRAQRDWGKGQPRLRLMNLLYGGDPIARSSVTPKRGRGVGGVAWYGEAPAFVSTDMRDPRIGTLLGLARAADALALKHGLARFDAESSAERLYQSVEVELRVRQCESEDPEMDCDPAEIRGNLPPVAQFADYTLWKVHSIEPAIASRLVEALVQAFDEFLRIGPEPGRLDGLMHLTGDHSTVVMDGAYWLHLDADFGMAPLAGHELAEDYARLSYLPERMVLDADPYAQGFSARELSIAARWAPLRELGVVPALAFVRETLVEGSHALGSRARLFDAAAAVLPEIDREIGDRSVIVRPVLQASSNPCPTDPDNVAGASCQYLEHALGDEPQYRVSSTTRGDDPLVELTLAPRSRQIDTVALDPHTVSFEGVSRADLDGYSTVGADIEAFIGYADGYQKRVFAYEVAWEPVQRLLLKGQDPGGDAGDSIYMPLAEHPLFSDQSFPTSFGGELNRLGEITMATLPADWSRPAYDAFGLPADWVPPADASLVGGSPGEQSYTYYLRVARQAAEEATAAVQVAIDNLILETEQQVDLEAAEQRAETIADIERASICGDSEQCTELRTRLWSPPRQGNCSTDDLGTSLGGSARDLCEAATEARDKLYPMFEGPEDLSIVGLIVTDEAYEASVAGTPTFFEFAGSELQGVLIRQWNALQTLASIDAAFLSQARALGIATTAAEAELASASSERDAADADIDAQLLNLNVNDMEIAGQLAALEAEEATYMTEVNTAIAEVDKDGRGACSRARMEDAQRAGESFSGATNRTLSNDVDNFGWHVGSYDSRSWSPGPMYSQLEACRQARIRWSNLMMSFQATVQSIGARKDALLARVGNPEAVPPVPPLSDSQRQALNARRAAAYAAYDAAVATVAAAGQERWSQIAGSLSELQAAIGEVVSSQAAFDQLGQRLEGVSAEEALEKDLAEKQADARFGIQRKFRSYDMWRARALLESARRLSVAARRAVESHFVVDLSDLDATQAFVESPSVWADEIYGSDLDAPSVVGLSATPDIKNAIFPNKLIDYVENLERFVQGYTISYPTSQAEPDTEVLSLSAPDLRQMLPATTGEDAEVEVVSSESMGWSFYCPDTRAWLPNPGVGEHPLENTLETLCGDAQPSQPTRARYAFTLDPWGRLGGAIAFDPFEQRHNVRWTRLAVNLVGVGIRDCEQAADPLRCHSEPFLRYDLKHVGPAWTTNHAEEWRAFGLPTALIEGGKALASEEWLDPLTNSWNTPLVTNAARTELFGRSVGGSYALELELGPEVQLSRIERVQVLAETRYWVRQE